MALNALLCKKKTVEQKATEMHSESGGVNQVCNIASLFTLRRNNLKSESKLSSKMTECVYC